MRFVTMRETKLLLADNVSYENYIYYRKRICELDHYEEI